MADTPLSTQVVDAIRQLAYRDGERVSVMAHLAQARERAARDIALEAVQARVQEAQDRLVRTAATRRALEAEIEDLNLRVRKTEGRLVSGKLATEREILAAEHEIENLRTSIRERETSWIDVSGQEDTLVANLPPLRTALDAEERAAARRQDDAREEVAAIEARLAAIDSARRAAAGLLPPEVRERYRALYQRTGGRPFAFANAGECGNCHRTLPATVVQMMRAHTGVPNCPSCGRLLLQQ